MPEEEHRGASRSSFPQRKRPCQHHERPVAGRYFQKSELPGRSRKRGKSIATGVKRPSHAGIAREISAKPRKTRHFPAWQSRRECWPRRLPPDACRYWPACKKWTTKGEKADTTTKIPMPVPHFRQRFSAVALRFSWTFHHLQLLKKATSSTPSRKRPDRQCSEFRSE